MHHRKKRRVTLWVAGAAVLGCGAYAVLPGARSEADAAPAPAAGAAPAAEQAGARTPFVIAEAEKGELGGGATTHALKPGDPAPTKASPETEASGYSYVRLAKTGQAVAVANTSGKPANTLVVRASVPDAPQGGGIDASLNLYVDGAFRQAVTISSKQAWNYRGATTNADDPNAGGVAYRFYNEFPVRITGAPIPAGSKVTLRKDAANTAAYYDVDSLDFENVGAPRTRPADSLSVVDQGADPAFAKDSTVAIQKTVDLARQQHKSVWIPEGKYLTNSYAGAAPLDFSGVTVRGAGMWYTTIYRRPPLPAQQRTKIQVRSHTVLSDIQIDSNAVYRDIGGPGGADYGIAANGSEGWLVERIWTRHTDANWLSGTGGTVRDSRTSDSYGDGFNINNGGKPSPDGRGDDITVQNNFARNAGDDSFAVYSDAGANGDNGQLTGARVLNNTAIAPWWANGLRIAGGKDIQFKDNLVQSVSSNSAMEVGIFGDTGHPLESATVSGNVLIGGSGWNGTRHGVQITSPGPNSRFPDAYTNVTMTGNTLRGSLRAGLFVSTSHVRMTFTDNVIDGPAKQGIWIGEGAVGTGTFARNTVRNLLPGQAELQNDAKDTFKLTQ